MNILWIATNEKQVEAEKKKQWMRKRNWLSCFSKTTAFSNSLWLLQRLFS